MDHPFLGRGDHGQNVEEDRLVPGLRQVARVLPPGRGDSQR